MRNPPAFCIGLPSARLAARLGAALLLASGSPLVLANCHTLLDQRGVIVFQSTTSPINLAQRISTELAARFPGHHLVMSDANNCPEVDELSRRRAGGPAGTPVDLYSVGQVSAARGGGDGSIAGRDGYTVAGEPSLVNRFATSGRAARPDRR